jgi:hypothetical protein
MYGMKIFEQMLAWFRGLFDSAHGNGVNQAGW